MANARLLVEGFRIGLLLVGALLCSPFGSMTFGQSAPPPAAENAATHYARAHVLASRESGLLTEDEWSLVYDLASGQSPVRGSSAWMAQARAAMAKAQPILEATAGAAGLADCDWNLDRAQGFAMLMPHLQEQRNLGRLLAARCALAIADGDTQEALAAERQIVAMGQHLAQDRILIGSLVGASVTGLATSRAEDLLASGMVSGEEAQAMAELLAGAAAGDAFGMADATRGEGDMVSITLSDAQQRQLMAKEPGFDMLDDLSEQDAEVQLAQLKGWYGQCADALVLEDRHATREAITSILEEVEASENTLAHAVMPSFDALLTSRDRIVDRLRLVAAQFDAIARGAVPATEHANAAYWYLKAAAATSSIPADVQTVTLMARIAPASVGGDQSKRLTEVNERMDRALAAPLRMAGAIRSCDFGMNAAPALDLLVMGTLRGALRFELIDAVRRSPQDAAVAIEQCLRAVRHLAADPTAAHALTAALLLDDVAWALQERCVGPDDSARLLSAVQGLDAPDPCGFRRASQGEVDELFGVEMPNRADPAVRETRLARAKELTLDQLFFIRCAWAPGAEEWELGEDLERWDEIVPVDRLREARARVACLDDSCFSGSDADEIRTRPLLGSCEPFIVVDLGDAPAKAAAALATIQGALIELAAEGSAPAAADPTLSE
ncbi:MAG: hypothetical protein O2819_00170 [Planctomycetota bacterium]|nr:hypothetical protein [Planctomycetota bacterium]MDA1105361.1 hypothetical protein [Planctomycetota bacterium]